MVRVSIIIPVLNESPRIPTALKALQRLRGYGHEIIVVDGGSGDDSINLAEPLCDSVVTAAAGRAMQMNVGAGHAAGDYLLFLHVDTTLDETAQQALLDAINMTQTKWAFFNVVLDARGMCYRIIESMMNWRSKLTQVATGDQCLLVKTCLFRDVGGFPDIELMEDVAMSKILRSRSAPLVIESPVTTSARRWQRQGLWRTVIQMWVLRTGYALGVSPRRLHGLYYGNAKG